MTTTLTKLPNGNVLISRDGKPISSYTPEKQVLLHPTTVASVIITDDSNRHESGKGLTLSLASLDQDNCDPVIAAENVEELLIALSSNFFFRKTLEIADVNNLQPALDAKQPNLSLGGGLFSIYAEERGALANNRFEWGFGDSDASQNGFGITIPFNCKLIALTLTTRQGSATVNAFKNTTDTGKAVTSDGTARRAVSDFKNSPVDFVPGDCINFKTITAAGVTQGGKVTAWFLIQ